MMSVEKSVCRMKTGNNHNSRIFRYLDARASCFNFPASPAAFKHSIERSTHSSIPLQNFLIFFSKKNLSSLVYLSFHNVCLQFLCIFLRFEKFSARSTNEKIFSCISKCHLKMHRQQDLIA